MALDPGAMHDRIIANLPEKTGHPLDHWITALADAPDDQKARIAELKAKGLGHHTAVAVVREADGDVPWRAGTDLEATLTAKMTPDIRAVYDALRDVATGLPGVTVVPCKTYTGFKTTRQFAVLRPTASGLELGLALPVDADAALVPAPNLGSARITAKAQIDLGSDGLARLLHQAHEAA
ncbi:MAG: DUF5655 domain-containing protein [Pseudomonadota bacterium]